MKLRNGLAIVNRFKRDRKTPVPDPARKARLRRRTTVNRLWISAHFQMTRRHLVPRHLMRRFRETPAIRPRRQLLHRRLNPRHRQRMTTFLVRPIRYLKLLRKLKMKMNSISIYSTWAKRPSVVIELHRSTNKIVLKATSGRFLRKSRLRRPHPRHPPRQRAVPLSLLQRKLSSRCILQRTGLLSRVNCSTHHRRFNSNMSQFIHKLR